MDEQQGKRDVVGMIRKIVELAMPNPAALLPHHQKGPYRGRIRLQWRIFCRRAAAAE